MRRILKQIAVAFVVILAAIFCVVAVRRAKTHEPTYGGRTFSSWFYEDELAPNSFFPAEATKSIVAMGDPAVPFIKARVRHEDSWWETYYWQHYSQLPARVKKILGEPHKPGIRQTTAAELLYQMGVPASANADLITAYTRAYCKHFGLPIRSSLDWTMQLTNPPAALFTGGPIPAPEGQFRFWALQDLARSSSDDPQVIPLLLCALHEPDANMHGLVLDFMKTNTRLEQAITRAEPALLIALKDSNPIVREPAARMLGVLATNHPEVVLPLIKAVNDLDDSVRDAAVKSLAKAPVQLTTMLPLVAPLFAHRKPELRIDALALVIHAGGGGAKFLSALNDSLSNSDPAVRAAAAQALRFLGPRAKIAVPKLTELTEESHEPDATVRQEAAAALQRIAPDKMP